MPVAGSMRGTLIVCGPTPNRDSSQRTCCNSASNFEPPVVEAEQDADAHVVDAGFHGAVHGGDAPIVVALQARGVDPGVGVAVVGLLEQLEGADLGRFQPAEVVETQRRQVDVDAADFAPAAADRIDRADRAEDVVQALGLRVGQSAKLPLFWQVGKLPHRLAGDQQRSACGPDRQGSAPLRRFASRLARRPIVVLLARKGQ